MELNNAQNGPNWKARIHLGWEAERACIRLGLPNSGVLAQGLTAGASGARAAMGANYPVTYSGERMWGESHAELVRLLAPFGWETRRIDGVDIIIKIETGIGIIVTAGSNVGDPAVPNPQPRYPRRTAVQQLVNGGADSLFDEEPRPEWDVYFLLHEVTSSRLRGELSRPAAIGGSGEVVGWSDRIMVPFGHGDDGGYQRTKLSPVAPQPTPTPIDIDLRRRAG